MPTGSTAYYITGITGYLHGLHLRHLPTTFMGYYGQFHLYEQQLVGVRALFNKPRPRLVAASLRCTPPAALLAGTHARAAAPGLPCAPLLSSAREDSTRYRVAPHPPQDGLPPWLHGRAA